MTATLGHNSKKFGEHAITKDERLRYAKEALLCAKLFAACAFMTKKEVIGTREGIRGRILRSILIEYLHVRGCPKKDIAKILDMDKDQPGDDIRNVALWRDHSKTDAAIHAAQAFLDRGLDLADGMDALIARCVNTGAEQDEEEEPPAQEKPKPPPPPKKEPYNPAIDPKPDSIRRKREAAELQATKNFEQRDVYLTKRMEHEAKLIVLGKTKSASKEQRDEVPHAEDRLNAYSRERKKLRRERKASNPAPLNH